jgi:predicted GNAT superfamily acetyltransferase
MNLRPLTTIEECRRVADLERIVWGDEDVVPPFVLIVSVKRGGILIGAFDAANEMKGFVYSLPAIRNGRSTQWSHMLGVAPEARGSGLGVRLKRAQREAALEMGVDLIEWTYDPLQATNAHLNFAKLGVIAGEYQEDVYGASGSPLHRGAPTDRLIAEWRLREPHVERRIGEAPGPIVRDGSVARAPVVNPSRAEGDWLVPGSSSLTLDARQLLVEIPAGFQAMLERAPALALEWRMATRAIFQRYFSRGYRAVDFFLTRPGDRGHYLLARDASDQVASS